MARRKQKKYNFIYKTMNLITNKFYLGMRSTDNLEDGYLGSGKILIRSVKKYGKENHKREILEFLSDREKLKEREKEIVNEDILKDPLCMNLMIGGEGGYSEESIRGASNHLKNLWKDPDYLRRHINKIKKLHKEGKIKYDTFTNKNHSEKTKEKMREKAHLRIGNKNSQFGTCWIMNLKLKENKKIKKEELQIWIKNGWISGRKNKW
jgi:hypothetical protein